MKNSWLLVLAFVLIVGCKLIPGGIEVEACLTNPDHPEWGRICAVVVDKTLFLKYDLSLDEKARATAYAWAKEKLGLK